MENANIILNGLNFYNQTYINQKNHENTYKNQRGLKMKKTLVLLLQFALILYSINFTGCSKKLLTKIYSS